MQFKDFSEQKVTFPEFKEKMDSRHDLLEQIMAILGFTKYKELAEYLNTSETYISKAKTQGVPDRWLMYIAMINGIPLYYLLTEDARRVAKNTYRYISSEKICFRNGEIEFSSFEKIFIPKSMLAKYNLKKSAKLAWFVNATNSMSPTFKVNDIICCELDDDINPQNGGIYLIRNNGLTAICRIQVLQNSYRIYYDNKELVEEEVENIDVIARILYSIKDFV